MRHKKNNAKFSYHRYTKEITVTFSLISCQNDYTRVSNQCININKFPTCLMSQKVHDIYLKTTPPFLRGQIHERRSSSTKTELNT